VNCPEVSVDMWNCYNLQIMMFMHQLPHRIFLFQLECTSCGCTCFSSRDAITTLTEDAPTTAGNVGTAPLATAKFEVVEKQLTSPRDQSGKPASDALRKSTAAYMPTMERQKSFVKPKDEPSPAPKQG
jgi:hypothetical protein